jgi:hypothetical protein
LTLTSTFPLAGELDEIFWTYPGVIESNTASRMEHKNDTPIAIARYINNKVIARFLIYSRVMHYGDAFFARNMQTGTACSCQTRMRAGTVVQRKQAIATVNCIHIPGNLH